MPANFGIYKAIEKNLVFNEFNVSLYEKNFNLRFANYIIRRDKYFLGLYGIQK